MTLADGRVVAHTEPLTEERDEWQACGDPY
jgi:hypothetical protein